MGKKALFLFAPRFREFAVDIIHEMIAQEPELQIAGLCMEGDRVVNFFKEKLPEENLYALWDLNKLENDWATNEVISSEVLARIDDELGAGASGQIIVADRRIGRGYVRNGICWSDSLAEMSVSDPLGAPLKYSQGLFKFCTKVFSEFQPDVVFCYAVASAPAVMLGLMSQSKNVTFLRFSSTRIGNLYLLEEGYKGKSQAVLQQMVSNQLSSDSITMAENYLNEYRKSPTQPNYVAFTRNRLKSGLSKVLLETSKMGLLFLKDTYFSTRKIKRVYLSQLKRKLYDIQVELRRKRVSLSIFQNNLPDYKFLYFPLHVDPEASTMVMAPMHTDQLSVIEAISKSLPGDMVLVVKEHLPMIGRRPSGFYEALKKIPKVILVNPYFSSLDLVRKSEAVVSITGTASLEAILLKKKTVIVGEHPILSIGEGFIYEPSLANLPNAIAKLKDIDYAKEEVLIKYLASIFQNAFPMDTSMLWGNYRATPEKKKKETIEAIATGILRHLH